MSERKIYLVTGSTGEYSDRTEWNVAAYTDRAEAEKHVTLLEAMLRLYGLSEDQDVPSYSEREEHVELMCKVDPAFECDYTGTRYFMSEVPLRKTAPKSPQDCD